MKLSQNGNPAEPCNLVSAKIRRSSNVWEAFEMPMYVTEGFHCEDPYGISEETSKAPGWMKYIGIIFAISSSIVFSLASIVIKTLESYQALNLSTWRFQGVILPNLFIIIYYAFRGKSDVIKGVWPLSERTSKKNWAILFLRGLLGGSAVVSQVYAIQYLSVADATVIAFSTPVFVTFLAYFILKESLGFIPVFASIFTLGGVFIITRPPMLSGVELSVDNMIGIGMALICMVSSAFIMIILRFLRSVNPTIITSAYGIVGTTLTVSIALGCGVFQFPEGRDDWIFAGALGLLTFMGQLFYTLALQYEEAGPVSLIRSGDVIFAFTWEFIFLGVLPDVFSVVGAVIVITGVGIIGGRKWVQGLPEDDTKRKRFSLLLK